MAFEASDAAATAAPTELREGRWREAKIKQEFGMGFRDVTEMQRANTFLLRDLMNSSTTRIQG